MINGGVFSDSTSACGAMVRHIRGPILVGLMLFDIIGTSSANALPADMVSQSRNEQQQTTAGVRMPQSRQSRGAIVEARRISGLTWEQLARLFSVSRRSVHFWASGKAMASEKEERLQRVIGVMRRVDSGSARANRAALLSVNEDGYSALDLLTQGRYELATRLLETEQSLPRWVAPALDEEIKAARKPRAPEEFVGAIQDRIERGPTVTRVARRVRTRGGR